jgi:ketosteroid isomerase-like protein
MIRLTRKLGLLLVAFSATLTGRASAQVDTAVQSPNVAPVLSAARRFHELLAAGDSAGTIRLLAPDLVVVESGSIETRADYLAHHLNADIEFARAVPAKREVLSIKREGDVAWVVSSSVATGKMRDRQIESRGAELMVLSRSEQGWLIRAIHWSSRRQRGGGN